MHFEYVGARSAIATYHRALAGQPAPSTSVVTETSFPAIAQGSANTKAVTTLQYALVARGSGITVDGVFGVRMKAVVTGREP